MGTELLLLVVVNTFDGEGFPTCSNVAQIIYPNTVDEVVSIVKSASASNTPVRALGGGHSWYNTSCSDDPNTIVIKTENLNRITNLDLANGFVEFEGGCIIWIHPLYSKLTISCRWCHLPSTCKLAPCTECLY
jgi:FAD/FMN-containing dehydrogenase